MRLHCIQYNPKYTSFTYICLPNIILYNPPLILQYYHIIIYTYIYIYVHVKTILNKCKKKEYGNCDAWKQFRNFMTSHQKKISSKGHSNNQQHRNLNCLKAETRRNCNRKLDCLCLLQTKVWLLEGIKKENYVENTYFLFVFCNFSVCFLYFKSFLQYTLYTFEGITDYILFSFRHRVLIFVYMLFISVA